mgnify:CR=1 FL=1
MWKFTRLRLVTKWLRFRPCLINNYYGGTTIEYNLFHIVIDTFSAHTEQRYQGILQSFLFCRFWAPFSGQLPSSFSSPVHNLYLPFLLYQTIRQRSLDLSNIWDPWNSISYYNPQFFLWRTFLLFYIICIKYYIIVFSWPSDDLIS